MVIFAEKYGNYMKTQSKSIPQNVTPSLIRFNWAMKRLLRQNANYTVLEGLWIYYLKNNDNKLSEQEKFDYLHYVKQRLNEQNSIDTATMKGEAIGINKAFEKVAINRHRTGYSIETISTTTGLASEQIVEIQKIEWII